MCTLLLQIVEYNFRKSRLQKQIMKQFLLISLLTLLFSCSDNSSSKTTENKIETLLNDKMKDEGIPGLQLVVVKEGQIAFSKSLGLANVPFLVRTNENTIFSINSIAKIFASTAILQLEEKGKLNVTDSISKHLDGLPKTWNNVTIRQLLSHTSGLPDIEDPKSGALIGGKGQDSAWVMLKKMPHQFKNGDDFSYNATNYLLIQKIIEKYSEQDYEGFLEKNQFEVAGMDSVYFGNSFDVIANKCPTYCYYYQDKASQEFVKGNELLEVKEEFYSNLKTDAGAFTTAENIAKWVLALQKGRLISKQSISKMWNPTKLNNGKYGGFDKFINAYALGWPVSKTENNLCLMAIGGGRASVNVYPKENLTVIILTNLTGIPAHKIADDISRIYIESN